MLAATALCLLFVKIPRWRLTIVAAVILILGASLAAFAPVFDELDRRGAVVYFHPTNAPCSQCLPEIPAATLDFPFDTTRAIVSLLFSGTFARCRNIRFIFSHAGGTAQPAGLVALALGLRTRLGHGREHA